MSRRYVLLVALVLAGATVVGTLSRRTGGESAPAATVDVPVVELVLAVEDGQVTPAAAAVPKEHRVRLRVTNRGRNAVSIRLAGYEERVDLRGLAPGATGTLEFVADRPGEDFAWLVDDQPAGRFAVTGSHLVEGHR